MTEAGHFNVRLFFIEKKELLSEYKKIQIETNIAIQKEDNDLNLETGKEQSANEVEEKSNDSEEEIAEKKEGVE